MKNLRKVLAMVLVIVLAFSLVTIASAKQIGDYSDASGVKYTEAVDLATGLAIMQGGGGTTFDPTGTFTREMAAKVITFLKVGPTVAATLTTATSSFSDVAANRWSAPFIEYCASIGIINGYGDGKFGPTDPVTGSQFAKMLLMALGYGQKGEYTGAAWELNTIIKAKQIGILDTDVNYTAPATREEVAKYVFNVLTKDTCGQVTYSKAFDLYSDPDDGDTLGVQTFGLSEADSDINGVDGHKWMIKSGTVAVSGTYSDETVLGTITNGTAIGTVSDTSSTKYIADLADDVAYYYNGNLITATAAVDAGAYYVQDNLLYLDAGTEYSVRGALVTLYGDADGNIYKVAIIEKTVDVIDADGVVVTDNLNTPDDVTVDLVNGDDITGTVKEVVGYTGLVKGDVVLYYTAGGVTYIEKAAKAAGGAVTAITGGKYTIGGTVYQLSQISNDTGTGAPALGNTTATYFLDNYGYIVDVVGPAAVVPTDYAMVLQYEYTPKDAFHGIAASSVAQVLLPDGTEKIFNLVTNAGLVQDDELTAGMLVKYIASGTTITDITVADSATLAGTAIDIDRYDTSVAVNDDTFYLNSKTIFFYYNVDAEDVITYGVVVGNAKVDSDTAATATDSVVSYDATTAGVLKAIVIDAAFVGEASGAPTYAYVTDNTPVQTQATVAGVLRTVYTYTTYVDGAVKTIATLDDDQVTAGGLGIYTITLGANGYYTFSTEVAPGYDADQVTVADSSYIVIDGDLVPLADTVQVYKATLVAGDVTKLETSTLALSTTKDTVATVVLNGDGEVAYMFFYYV